MRTDDLRGYGRLAIDATTQMTRVVENMHRNIALTPLIFGQSWRGRTYGITGLVYESIRVISSAVGIGMDQTLKLLTPLLDTALAEGASSPAREALLAIVNGVVGDHLAESANPLAIRMSFRRDGIPLKLEKYALSMAIPHVSNKLLVMVHGLCMNDVQFLRNGHDHGTALTRDLGYTPVYLHYNSGLHVSQNGREFAGQLEQLVRTWPVKVNELVVVGFSMGGLLTRSACHYAVEAGHKWPRTLKKIIFVGTPHHGAPLERGGNKFQWLAGLTPYTAPLAKMGMLRSAGITDLRHGNLLDEDWHERDRFAHHEDLRRPLPLPAGVRCYALAASTGARSGDLSDTLLGDGIVFLNSALGHHTGPERALGFAEADQLIVWNTSHLGMLSSAAVYGKIREWLSHPKQEKTK